jgi:hypothetical protein
MTKIPPLPRTMSTLLVISVPLNFIWEVAQMPLYVKDGKLLEFAAHCIIPSVGDGVIVLMIYGVGLAAWRRVDWFVRPAWPACIVMLLTGLVIALLVEWVAVYGIGRWSYTANMPLLPMLNVGLSPVLQMLLLPPVIFKAAAWCLNRPR